MSYTGSCEVLRLFCGLIYEPRFDMFVIVVVLGRFRLVGFGLSSLELVLGSGCKL